MFKNNLNPNPPKNTFLMTQIPNTYILTTMLSFSASSSFSLPFLMLNRQSRHSYLSISSSIFSGPESIPSSSVSVKNPPSSYLFTQASSLSPPYHLSTRSSTYSSLLSATWPNHFGLLSYDIFPVSSTLIIPLMHSFLIPFSL